MFRLREVDLLLDNGENGRRNSEPRISSILGLLFGVLFNNVVIKIQISAVTCKY